MNVKDKNLVARPGWFARSKGSLVEGYRFAVYVDEDEEGGYFHYLGAAFAWEDYEAARRDVLSLLN